MRENRDPSRRVGYFACVLALLAIAAVGASLYGNRERYDRADFRLYYAWWAEFRHGIDPWQPLANAPTPGMASGMMVSYCNYTPGYVVLLSPFALFAQRTAYWLWLVLQLGSLILSVVLLARELQPPPRGAAVLSIIALVLLFPPVHATLHGAQPTFLLLLLLSAAWLFERRASPTAAALMLALAALLKLYPAAAAGYFLFRRRLSVVIRAVLFTLLGAILTGPERWREFFVYGVPMITTELAQERMVSAFTNLYHLLEQLFGPTVQYGWWLPAGALTLALGVLMAVRAGVVAATLPAGSDADGLYFGAWLAVALLLSPMSWDHELPLLVPAYLFALAGFARGRLPYRAPMLVIMLSLLASAAGFFLAPLRSFHLYFLSTLALFAAACSALHSASIEAQSGAKTIAKKHAVVARG